MSAACHSVEHRQPKLFVPNCFGLASCYGWQLCIYHLEQDSTGMSGGLQGGEAGQRARSLQIGEKRQMAVWGGGRRIESGSRGWCVAGPMVLWELLFVVIDPEEVEDLVAGACCDVSFKDCHVSFPQHMHQICTTILAFALHDLAMPQGNSKTSYRGDPSSTDKHTHAIPQEPCKGGPLPSV